MSRRRLDPNAPALSGAERQRRYREARRAAGGVEKWVQIDAEREDLPAAVIVKKMKRAPSRPHRWAQAIEDAQNAIAELRSVHEEYQEWKDNLPLSLSSSSLGEKLEMIAALDIDQLESALSEFESADLPLGFGRD